MIALFMAARSLAKTNNMNLYMGEDETVKIKYKVTIPFKLYNHRKCFWSKFKNKKLMQKVAVSALSADAGIKNVYFFERYICEKYVNFHLVIEAYDWYGTMNKTKVAKCDNFCKENNIGYKRLKNQT